MTAEEATEDVILNQLPEVDRLNRSGVLAVENVDVFCEKGVYDVAQTKRILEAGRRAGLRVNFHAEELSCLGGAEVSRHERTSERSAVLYHISHWFSEVQALDHPLKHFNDQCSYPFLLVPPYFLRSFWTNQIFQC